MEFRDFLEQFNGIPKGGIMAPWITDPPDYSFNSENPVIVKGWAADKKNPNLVLYEVEPSADLTRPEKVIKQVGLTRIDNDTKEWQIEIDLQKDDQFFAARLERSEDEVSSFSNIVYISKYQPVALRISSPKQGEVIQSDQVTLEGTGQQGIGLVLSINDEKTDLTTIIDREGNWRITDVPLIVQGFDQNSLGRSVNKYDLSVFAEATDQSASVTIRDTEPIQLQWPFGIGEGENFEPAKNLGTVTAFYGNDWHKKHLKHDHWAWDISTSSGCVRGSKIHAVSGGKVVVVGSNSDYGGYIIIDSGSFGVLYLHVMEIAVKKNDTVIPGQMIAYEGYVNSPDGKCDPKQGAIKVHLHIEVAVWGPGVDKSSYSTFKTQQKVNLNPPITVKDTFIKQNSNLYHFWGPDDYCGLNGCWVNMDWNQLKINPVKKVANKNYDELCLSDFNKITNTDLFSGRSARYQWCLLNPSECECK
jgi:murein DD-endopeptidase MepM/ murein hydrolase activator NlpD